MNSAAIVSRQRGYQFSEASPAVSSPADTQCESLATVSHYCHFLENHAESLGDNNDQSGDRAATTAARNGVTSSQAIELTRTLGDTNDWSGDIKEESPHRIRPMVCIARLNLCFNIIYIMRNSYIRAK